MPSSNNLLTMALPDIRHLRFLALSQSLDSQTYLDTVNDYFDRTATAVVEHAGEVRKFIGDEVARDCPLQGLR